MGTNEPVGTDQILANSPEEATSPQAVPNQDAASAPTPPAGAPAQGDWKSQLGSAAQTLGITPGTPPAANNSSPTVTSIMKGAGESAKANPEPTKPGAWARNLLGGVVSALGDAAAGGENLKSGQGWLAGVNKTLQARTQRLAQEKQLKFENDLKLTKEQREAKNDESTRALTAAQTYHTQKTASLVEQQTAELAQKVTDQHIATGKATVDLFRKNHDVQDGVDEGTLQNLMTADAKNPTPGPNGKPQGFYDKYSVFQTGTKDVTGPDGKPHTEQIFSLVKKSANPVLIDQATADLVKKNGGADLKVGTEMPGDLLDSQITQAQQVQQSRMILEGNNDKELVLEKDANLRNALQNTGRLIAADVNDPMKGLQQGLETAKQHQNQLGVLLQNAQKQGDAAGVEKYQGQIAQVKKEEADINTVMNSPQLADMRAKAAEAQEKRAQAYKAEGEGNKANAEAKLASDSGGTAGAARLAEAYDWPGDLSKRSKDLEARKSAADEYSIKKYGHPVDWSKLQTDHDYISKKSTQDVMGLINSVGEQGGSLDIALSAAKGIPNVTDSNTLNKVFSKAGGEFGNESVSNFHTAMYGLADEYAKIMGGGNATVPGFDHAMNLLRDGYAKGQMDGAAQILRSDMDARKRGIIGNNIYMIRKYDPQNADARIQAVQTGKDPWAAEKAAGKYVPNNPDTNKPSGNLPSQSAQSGGQGQKPDRNTPLPTGAHPIIKNGQPVGYITADGKTRVDY